MNKRRLLTYLDSCFLIDAYRGSETMRRKALRILTDPDRDFASSEFVKLEVLPGPMFHKDQDEAEFHQAFFEEVSKWAACHDELIEVALKEAITSGVLGAVDALHVAAAAQLGCDEFVTSEGPDKPICRASLVKVTSIR
jgi:predicted nucleic acid-binding protein